jgi:hypothetical protein
MSSEPFSISLIVERLQPLTPEPLSFLGTIVEYSQVTELSGFAVPGAYVLMGPERGVPGTEAGHRLPRRSSVWPLPCATMVRVPTV